MTAFQHDGEKPIYSALSTGAGVLGDYRKETFTAPFTSSVARFRA